ncbi:Flagellar motor switch protein FliM [Tepidanaerobacter acetatoxydans Re1]|uniref:Flagellar motor switch protein FliM n=1 Tax=Tepidanaerobacter acetatoxydans (strain DSM 21804 / JCM 16047 / Re1) TaxID=1209989 RepID=F4LTP9_TEPAE|nr:flagellar motor switch protein FliM [Tepidanaerobacter acetatoxydans]AEE91379.1 flagellar motor switch protein FliM [Tepidanaerobacter acetatoxydans Re1]CCP26076.2 Flagellar motor switch protein FliM [Tepidanaerobacter acetatoxydans Re1]
MSDILSQNEIDALLSALSTGEVKAEEIKSKELDKKVKPYDFKRPNKFSKEQLHTLSMIHENFARLLTTYLSAQLRTVVQINVFFVEQMTYNEFIFSIPNPSLIAVVDFSPLKGAAIMEINPSIAFSIIDRLLGGPGEYSGKLREPTEIETGIIEKVFSKMTRILSDAWKDIADIQTTLEKLETNSQFVQLVSPNEAVALITFNAKVGNSEGMINICIPHIVLEPIIPKLSTRIWLSTSKQEQAETTKQFITEKVYDTKTEIRAELGRTLITVGEFINLATGDVIALNKNIKDGADIFIKDKLKFSGSIGVHRNKMAIKIQKKFGEGGEFNG